jgi:hypothetical protein
MNSRAFVVAAAFACVTPAIAAERDVDVKLEAVWQIGTEAFYTCKGARMNPWMFNDLMEAAGLKASETVTPAWKKFDEAAISVMHKQINDVGADAWCKRIALEYGPHGTIVPNAVLFDELPPKGK